MKDSVDAQIRKEQEILAWFDCYVSVNRKDPHSEFASKLDIPRSVAKQLALRIAHKVSRSVLLQPYKGE